ncbi:lyase family protein, partial [Bacteroides sp. 51]|uniref:lyase family protein n=1 Tax=Bacteroides sp. 51 TaxID=2302938 RepID=UPI001EF27C22
EIYIMLVQGIALNYALAICIGIREVGSSAMPHKVNPIDFENAEGNLYVYTDNPAGDWSDPVWVDMGVVCIKADFGENIHMDAKYHGMLLQPYFRNNGIRNLFQKYNILLSADRALALRDHLKIVHTLPETLFTADGR